MDTLRAFWDSLPAPLRSVINVCAGAALASFVAYLGRIVAGESFDLNAAVQVVLVAVSTALVRALNPLDSAYGVGSGASE